MSELISKAMNSTLGTTKFKAFDELMLDSKSLTPGDDVIIKFSETGTDYWYINEKTIPKTETEIVRFTMPLSGTILMRFNLRTNNEDYQAILNVYVNGTKYTGRTSKSRATGDTPDTFHISANRGDVITIKGQSTRSDTENGVTSYNTEVYLYDIRYKVVDVPRVIMTKSI